MFKNIVLSSVLVSSSLFSFSDFVPSLNYELKHNDSIIKEYQKRISQLQKRNDYLKSLKAKNPKLYEEKPLYEETKDAYIYRIKLNGAEAKNINFMIKHHMVSIDMNIKTTRDENGEYFYSSKSFFEQYTIPKNVDETKITHSIDGDYFVIKMPKK